MTAPAFAVVGLKDLLDPIKEAGFDLLVDDADPATVAAAARTALKEDRPYVVLIAGDAPVLRVWAQIQTAHDRRVLWLRSSSLPSGDLPDKARALELPVSINQILTAFGAPSANSDIGEMVVDTDGRLSKPGPQLRVLPDEPETFETPAEPEPERAPEQPRFSEPAPERPVRERFVPPVPRISMQSATARRTEPAMSQQSPFDDAADLYEPMPQASRAKLADVIVCFAGKGGVGKSTFTLALAQRAVEVGGMKRVVVVDANRGQGDIRVILRVSRANLPSIYDAAVTGDPKSALVTPEVLTKARHPDMPKLGIGVVLAPDDAHVDLDRVTEREYGDVIRSVREVADLVVIDTQIVEAKDTSGLIDRLVIPLLSSGGWGVGLTDSSVPGSDNLLRRLRTFELKGVPRDRLMFAMNRKDPKSEINVDAMVERANRYAHFIGVAHEQTDIKQAFERGALPHDSAELAVLLDKVLYQVTGLSAFDPARHAEVRPKNGLFARLFKKA